MRSPFNGELWPVPPEVNEVMYQALIKAGFEPVTEKPKPRKEKT